METLYSMASFRIGQRVQLHPCTDHWMRGDKYGTITRIVGHSWLTVQMDSGRMLRHFHYQNIVEILS